MNFGQLQTLSTFPSGGVAAYVGPLDGLSNIAAAYSTRKLLSAYEGNALRLRRDSDAAESDFGFTAAGDLDIAAIATWLGAASGFFTTWYDQSGNGRNIIQTTAGSQPLYVANVIGGRPVARFNNDLLYHATTTLNQPNTIFGVLVSVGEVGSYRSMYDSNATAFHLVARTSNVPAKLETNCGAALSAVSDLSSFCVVESVHNGANSLLIKNGATVASGNAGTNALTGFRLGNDRAGSAPFIGDVAEWIIFNAATGADDRAAVRESENDYFSLGF